MIVLRRFPVQEQPRVDSRIPQAHRGCVVYCLQVPTLKAARERCCAFASTLPRNPDATSTPPNINPYKGDVNEDAKRNP
jgi:hypothetical protein